jgi:hypothetical protein
VTAFHADIRSDAFHADIRSDAFHADIRSVDGGLLCWSA